MRIRFLQDYAQEIQEKRRILKIEYSLRYPAIMTFTLDKQRHQFPSPAAVKRFLSSREVPEGPAEDDGGQGPFSMGENG